MQGYFCRETANAGGQRGCLRDCCRFATAAASGGPIFSLAREKIGEKRALGYVWVLPASDFRQASEFRASFHTVVTLRMSWYAPPDTVGIRFVTSGLRTTAVNRRCGGNPGGCNLFARQIVGAEQSPAPTGCRANKEKSMQKVQANKSGLHLLFTANIQTQLPSNPLSRIRRRVVRYT